MIDLDKLLWDMTEGKREQARQDKEDEASKKEEETYFDELHKKRKAGMEAIQKKYGTAE